MHSDAVILVWYSCGNHVVVCGTDLWYSCGNNVVTMCVFICIYLIKYAEIID